MGIAANPKNQTADKTEDKPKDFFIFTGNLAEAREAFGENLAIRDTGNHEKHIRGAYYVSAYNSPLRDTLIGLGACGIIRARLIEKESNKYPFINDRVYEGIPVYRTLIAI